MSRRAKLHPIEEREFERRYGRGFSVPQHETTGWFAGEDGVLGVVIVNAYERWGFALLCPEPPLGIVCVARIDCGSNGYDNPRAAETALSIAAASELARRAKRPVAS